MLIASEYKFNTRQDFAKFSAEVCNALIDERDAKMSRIKGKEFDLFLALVEAWHEFGSISDGKKYSITPNIKDWVLAQGFSETDFSRYRGALVRKGWLHKEGGIYSIPTYFLPTVTELNYSVRIKYGLDG